MTVASRLLIMNAGQAVQVGTPAEIYEYPGSRLVAEFMGDANIMEARVVEAGQGRVLVRSAEAGCDIEADRGIAALPGEPVWVAVRPEKLELHKSEPPEGTVNRVEGTVWDIGYLGDVSIYHVRLASGMTVRATVANRQRLIERPVTWEDRVWLTWPPAASVILQA